ncbi:protein FAN isoform X1 [Neodiprion lecontei]|uniref:Protein FAN isoform X1 n=2 Tax=Neodiprion lecontei TaxID=441921 RepID=A0A6J0CB55_NEOLC|nr:protein FAN isoform X1 [Neodiprion lecontei]
MDKERFTMLLLEPGEIFFEDYSVAAKSIVNSPASETYDEWIDGRLKLCSKSLVFVNKELTKPLIKVQLKELINIEKWSSKDWSHGDDNILFVKCKQYVEMLQGNILAPYKFIHKENHFLFRFNYATIEDCLPQILQLLRATTLPTAEQNAMITAIVHSRQSRVSFDTSWLEDLYEQAVLELQADKISPLVVNPGRVLLTSSRIYFQPYNNMDQHPVLKIQLKDISQIIKRRFLLRQVGLEIVWRMRGPEAKKEHLFLSMRSHIDRDNLYRRLLDQSEVSLETVQQNQMTMQWQNGCLSNYDYLIYINSLADRTFHDLTQYPVFPWIIQDYTSSFLNLNDPAVYRDLTKPIGALEPTRLERLKERYLEMAEPKFLYGSHYSAPGFVLFYLVRKYPEYMLCLQNGRFDHPDRMFNSVADVWKNVLVNMSDFKELVPEFYDTETAGDFLANIYGIDFGYRHDGSKVNDVQLPPWAKDPADFVRQLRDALESPYVSQNLHSWIDLVFGYKQRGPQAVEANNVFFHLCYEGAVDLDTIQDINDRHGLEVQIMEFGQIPKQVFDLPHPKRMLSVPHVVCEKVVGLHDGSRFTETKISEIFTLQQSVVFQSHKDSVSCVNLMDGETGDDLISVGHDGMLKLYSMKTSKLTRSVPLSSLPLSSCISYKVPSQSNILVAGCWDNTIIFYDIEFGRIVDTLPGHEDAVSCLAWSSSRNILVSGSWDCTAKVWRSCSSGKKIKPAECLLAQLDHDAKITCINISGDDKLLACGTEDGELFLWCLEQFSLQFTVKGRMARVNAVVFDPESKQLVSCTKDHALKIMDVTTGTEIYSSILEKEPTSLCWRGTELLLVGDAEGYLSMWDLRGVFILGKFSCHNESITTLMVSSNKKKIVTGSRDRRVIIWDCK